MSGLSPGQYYGLVAVAATSSIASLVGSTAIIYRSCRSLDRLYDRILMTLSIADVLFSITNLVHPYLLPEDTPGLLFAVGNTTTCSFAGFSMTTLPLFITSCNCVLSLYFYLLVCRPWREEINSQRFQVPALIGAFVISVGTGIAGIVTESYNPSALMHVCYFNDFPQDCSDDPEVECIRGEIGDKVGWFGIGTLIVAAILGIGFTLRVHAHVKAVVSTQQRHSENYTFRDNPEASHKKMKNVAYQAILYTLVYLNSFMWPFLAFGVNEAVGNVKGREGEPALYALQFLAWLLFPIQGLLNAIVYFRVSYRRWRIVAPQSSRLYSLYYCVVKGAPEFPKPSGVVNSMTPASTPEEYQEASPPFESPDEEEDTPNVQ